MKVTVIEETGEIIIDGFRFYGYIDGERCQTCEEFQIYYDKYDAYFCPKCNKWKDSNCGDPDCLYCNKRPLKPLPT
jgi:hypothetical protein